MFRNRNCQTMNLGRPLSRAIFLLIALILTLLVKSGDVSAQGPRLPYVNDQLIVRYRVNIGDLSVADSITRQGDQKIRDLPNIQGRLVRLSGNRTVEQAIQEYRRDPNVLYAEPNYIVYAFGAPTDPQYPQLWGLKNTGQTVGGLAGTPGADIKAEQAWAVTTGSSSIVVGVVDSGVDYMHTDLAANMWNNPGNISGCAAGTHGYNAITKSCDPMDDNNHGTHVSGTIGAAGNNALGVVGVNWQTQIMGLKFLDSTGSGTTANAIAAIDFAITAKQAGVNIRVLNNSWGGSGFSQALLDEINKAGTNGILFVAAAGNNATNNDASPSYPCSYTAANLICVAATDQNDNLASFSNYGAGAVDLGAPGYNILSTIRNGSYAYFSGTSMATPHVSGSAALVLSAPGQGSLTVDQLRNSILKSVDSIPSLAGKVGTGGRLNVCKAIPGCNNAPSPTRTPTWTPMPASTFTPSPTSSPTFAATRSPTATPPSTSTFTPPPTRVPSLVPAPDFVIAANPGSRMIPSGASASYNVILAARNGYNSPVALSISGLPAGAIAQFNPSSVTPTPNGATSILSITTAATTPAGTWALTITGKDANVPGMIHGVVVTLVVGGKGGGSFNLSLNESWLMLRRNSTGTFTVRVNPSGGFNSPVNLSVSGVPQGVSAVFNPNPLAPNVGPAFATLKLTASNASGFYWITITGTGGGQSHSSSAVLWIR